MNLDANANLAAPIDGAVAANGNVAAPIDAAVGANIGSPDSVSVAEAPQEVDISQNLDHVSADATANQNADVAQNPAGGEAAPAGGEAAPAGGEAAPAGGEAAPAGGDAAQGSTGSDAPQQ